MRWTLIAAIAFSLSSPLAAQDAKTPDKKEMPDLRKSNPSEIKEIGGKTVDMWIKDISSKDPGKRTLALQAVQRFPHSQAMTALPSIVAELKRHSATNPIDVSVRANGLHALGILLSDEKDLDSKVEQEAVGLLVKFLKDPQVAVRFRAVHALSMIGPKAKPAMSELILLLKESTAWEVRALAAQVLGQIGSDSSGGNALVLGGLNGLTQDPCEQVRLAALQSMAVIGTTPDAATQAAALKSIHTLIAAKDTPPSVKVWCYMAQMALASEVDHEHINPIAKLIKNDDAAVRIQVLQALGAIGDRAKATVPSMLTALDDTDPNVVAAAVWALGRMEKSAMGAVPRLEAMVADTKTNEAMKKLANESLDLILKRKEKD